MATPVPPSAISTWTTVALCPSWVRWWATMDPSTWPIPPRPSVPFCWKTSGRSPWTKREKPTSSPRRWSRTAWRKWYLWTSTKPSRCSAGIIFDVPRYPSINHVCTSCSSLLMANQAVSVVLLAGGWWAGDQGVLCRPCPGSCHGAHQSGIRVCGLHCECKQVCTVSESVNLTGQDLRIMSFHFQGDYNMTPDRHLGWVAFTDFNDYMLEFIPTHYTVASSLCCIFAVLRGLISAAQTSSSQSLHMPPPSVTQRDAERGTFWRKCMKA